MWKTTLLSILVLTVISCSNRKENDEYAMQESDHYLSFEIADDVKVPKLSVFQFQDEDGQEYLTFQNERNEILIYAIPTGEFIKKITVNMEGDDAIVGGFYGYYMHDFNRIYIPSIYEQTITVMDSAKHIKQKIRFFKADDGEDMVPLLISPGMQMNFINGQLYIPQMINVMFREQIMEKSRVCASIDTVNNTVERLPMKFPPLITHKDIGTSAGFGADYNRCFDGGRFLYSFQYSHNVHKTSPAHDSVEELELKSRYIDKVEVLRMQSTDLNNVVRASGEYPSYGNIIFDKYRKVYYRIAYPRTTIEKEYDPFDILHYGRKVFSMMILNEDLEIIGETLFPEYTYNSRVFLVLEDGLYLSTSHIKNPDYSDDELKFRRIDLIKLKK